MVLQACKQCQLSGERFRNDSSLKLVVVFSSHYVFKRNLAFNLSDNRYLIKMFRFLKTSVKVIQHYFLNFINDSVCPEASSFAINVAV